MRRFLPPAGLPLARTDIRSALRGWIRPSRAAAALERDMERLYPERLVLLAPSGRAALFAALRACRGERPARDEVAMGAFTCWSVAAAAVRAGYRLRLLDLDPETYDFSARSIEATAWDRVAAVITHHLFGIPNDRTELARHAEKGGAWVIDDAAQGFGAREGGRPLGDAGIAGILSFGRGKSLPALRGGLLLLDPHGFLAKRVPPREKTPRGSVSFLRAAGHHVLLSDRAYGVARRLPFLGLGETVYEERFTLRPMDGFTAALASRLLGEAAARAAERRCAAAEYAALLAGSPLLGLPATRGDAEPGFIRYPVLVPPGKRDLVLRRAGHLGVSRSYPQPIHRIPALPRGALAGTAALPGAETISDSLVTLPTHPLATSDDRRTIASLLREVCG